MLKITGYAAPLLCVTLATIAQEHCSKPHSFLSDLQRAHEQIKKIQSSLSHFDSASSLPGAWQNVDTVITYFTNTQPDSFIADYKSASLFQKRVACGIMRLCVDTIDATIKTVKSSRSFDNNQKFDHMHLMLTRFHALWVCWAEEIMSYSAIQYHPQWPLSDYIHKINTLIKRKKNGPAFEYEFKKSSSFSVQAAVLGSGTAFERHYPSTLEDIFMLIHQNALSIVAALFNDTLHEQKLNDLIAMPRIAQDLCNRLESPSFAPQARDLFGHYLNPQRIGIRYSSDTVEIMYNMSLRNHSSTMQIVIDTHTNDCYLAVQFVGNARSRWEEVLLCAALSERASGIALKDRIMCDHTAGIVTFTWLIEKQEQIELIESYLTLMADLSYGRKLSLKRINLIKNMPTSVNRALDAIKQDYGSVGSLYSLYRY